MSFTSDVLKSQDIEDPKKSKRYLDELEQSSIAVQRQHGRAPAVGLNRFQQQDTANQWLGQEQQRRVDAGKQSFDLANTVDERIAGTRNQLADVYDKYNQSAAALKQKGGQSSVGTQLEVSQAGAKAAQERGNIDFTTYKNSAERKDALISAMRQGTAAEEMQDAAAARSLKIQDMENYWTTLQNEIDNELKDYQSASESDFRKWSARMEAEAQNTAAILQGVLTIGGAVVGGPVGAMVGGGVLAPILGGLFG